MKKEELFLAIGDIDSAWLERSEMPSHRKEELIMKRKPTRLLRNVLIAAAIMTILAVSVYAGVNQSNIRRGSNIVDIVVETESNEYREVPPLYPQRIPEGYKLYFVSDTFSLQQTIIYRDIEEKQEIELRIMVSGGVGERDVSNTEDVTVKGYPAKLYTWHTWFNDIRILTWKDEEWNVGFSIETADPEVDILDFAESIDIGEPLVPTYSAEWGQALNEIGDYRITALPDGLEEARFSACPLKYGNDWQSYIRRLYSDKITTDRDILFSIDHFVSENEEIDPNEKLSCYIQLYMTNHDDPCELVTVQGMPGAIAGEKIVWYLCGDGFYTRFEISGKGLTPEDLRMLAESVVCMNDHS